MAKALECPACGARHPIDTLPDARTFRCDRCGQVLKVPDAIGSSRTATVPPAAARASGPPPPPPRRGGSAATGPSVTATATATIPAATASSGGTERGRRAESTPSVAPRRRKARWYWRILAWVVAIPLGLLITGWPALQFDLLKKNDLLDVFVGSGAGRYTRLLVFAAAWALVTALLVQLLVEGGRWWAARRARARAAAV